MIPTKQLRTDLSKLKSFFLDKAQTCVHQPEGKLKYTYVTPTYAVVAGADDRADVPERSTVGHYLQMYDWDACFFSQAAHLAGIEPLAQSVVRNFLTLKESDGYIPRTISPQRIWDAGDMCKPFLCQSLVHNSTEQQLKSYADLVQDLECYLGYYQRHREHKSGLYRWRNVLESGVDDNLALLAPHEAAKDENEDIGSFPDGKLLAVDLSSYLAAEFRAFAKICQAAGNHTLSEKYDQKWKSVTQKIEELLWNERLAMYCNRFPDSDEQVTIRAWTGLTPFIMGLSSPDRARRIVESNVMAPEHFLRPTGIASVAASEPLYNNAKRGMYGRAIVSHWQGPMWVLPNALLVRAMSEQGFSAQAREVALRCTTTMANGLQKYNTLYENYHAETGDPLWAPQFMSWNVLALEMLALLESA